MYLTKLLTVKTSCLLFFFKSEDFSLYSDLLHRRARKLSYKSFIVIYFVMKIVEIGVLLLDDEFISHDTMATMFAKNEINVETLLLEYTCENVFVLVKSVKCNCSLCQFLVRYSTPAYN